jgi:hypothetical protein
MLNDVRTGMGVESPMFESIMRLNELFGIGKKDSEKFADDLIGDDQYTKNNTYTIRELKDLFGDDWKKADGLLIKSKIGSRTPLCNPGIYAYRAGALARKIQYPTIVVNERGNDKIRLFVGPKAPKDFASIAKKVA